MTSFSRLAAPLSTAPLEARLVSEIPDEPGWQFESKWDGFRCLPFRDGGSLELMSKSGKPLGRYFPEIVETGLSLMEDLLVLDGSAPGAVSRGSRGRSSEWLSIRAELVAEVGYDQVTGRRFRHGTSFIRWQPDKAPRQCRMDQLEPELRPARLKELLGEAAA